MQTPGVQNLVVDDEDEIRTLLRRCFEREGFQVLEDKDGAEFRACIEQAPISLITLDLTLGGEDGLELAREIRAKCNIPIIMITGKGDTIDRVLHPTHGRGLLHFIGRNHRVKVAKFSRRYIFPGTYAPVLSEVMERVLEPRNLSVVDVENLRRHYAATLHDWRLRFERASDDVRRMFDDRFVRMWRLYLTCAEAAFESGDSQLFQVTFERATDPATRWTRADLYAMADDPRSRATAHGRQRVV